jgi:hypothetical protein
VGEFICFGQTTRRFPYAASKKIVNLAPIQQQHLIKKPDVDRLLA